MLALMLSSCSRETTPAPLQTRESTTENSALPTAALFLDVESPDPTPPAAHIVRSRVVKINFPLLLDENGRARKLTGNSITLNLFPDVIYTGVIEQMEENGDSYSWVGYLQDVEFSTLTMILSSDVFIAKIASPGGVYEVSTIGGDLYRIILIDQQKLPGGEDAIDVLPNSP